MIVNLLLAILASRTWLVGLVCAAWAVGAVYFDSPWPALRPFGATLLGLVFLTAVLLLPGPWHKLAVLLGGFAAVLAWWLTLAPSNTHDWQPNVARTARAEIDGDVVTLHNVRNWDGLPFPELKARSWINPAARAAGDSPEFSRLIRAAWVSESSPV